MGKFNYLKELEVKDRISGFKIYAIKVNGESPTLYGCIAGESNAGYYNELLKRSFKYAKQISAGDVTASQLEENRDEDRALFPVHVINGWDNMPDDEGNDLPFTPEDCEAFFKAIPYWVFDEIRAHFSNPREFAGTVNIDAKGKDVKDKAKN